ncbi:aankyrin [Opitutaceae bacterium TAV5]|nr:aankyrin [Opitutaceae bacterium TAV5]
MPDSNIFLFHTVHRAGVAHPGNFNQWSSRGILMVAFSLCAFTSSLISASEKQTGNAGAAGRVTATSADDFVRFIDAARTGDVAEVRRLLAAGMDVNRGDAYGQPALLHAIDAGQSEVAVALVEAGADLTQTVNNELPLSWAAMTGDVGLARAMWKRGADPAAQPRRGPSYSPGATPLMRAVEFGHLAIARGFVNAGTPWRNETDRGTGALEFAARSGSVECIRFFLGNGADPDFPVPASSAWAGSEHGGPFRRIATGNTPLVAAVECGHLEAARVLIDAGADVNRPATGIVSTTRGLVGKLTRTPLVSAVLHNQAHLIPLLLERGADPRALDGLAIRLADLMGDREAYALLRQAGAPAPEPFAFREWLPKTARATDTDGEKTWSFRRLQLPGQVTDSRSAPALPPGGITLAIIDEKGTAPDIEAHLVARLSGLENVTLVERGEWKRIAAERGYLANGRVVEPARLGNVLGADALVFVQMDRLFGEPVCSVRVVSVKSGVVAGMVRLAVVPEESERVTDVLARCCLEAAARGFAGTSLVAVAPFVASTNTREARELERLFGFGISMGLAALPGVVPVERAELAQLRMETGGSDELLPSHWLLEGQVEPALTDGDAPSLALVLTPAGGPGETPGHAVRRLQIKGTGKTVAQVANEAIAGLTSLLDLIPESPGDREAEAGGFSEMARRYLQHRMWGAARAAAEAAWALGGGGDVASGLRMDAISGRLMYYEKYYRETAETEQEWSGLSSLVSRLDPLSVARKEDAGGRALSPEYLLEDARTLLDLFEMVLERVERQHDEGGGSDAGFAGQPFTAWIAGDIWNAATVPLRMTAPLSYEDNYGAGFNELRNRLLDLNNRAFALALSRGDTVAAASLRVWRCRNMPWWEPDGSRGRAEVVRCLRESRDWAGPLSGHAVWGGVWWSAWERAVTPPAVEDAAFRFWGKMARELVISSDAGERFLGLALLNRMSMSQRVAEDAWREASVLCRILFESESAWPGAIRRECTGEMLRGKSPWRMVTSWYADAMSVMVQPRLLRTPGGRTWLPGPRINSQPERLLEDWKRFCLEWTLTGLERMSGSGTVSGYRTMPMVVGDETGGLPAVGMQRLADAMHGASRVLHGEGGKGTPLREMAESLEWRAKRYSVQATAMQAEHRDPPGMGKDEKKRDHQRVLPTGPARGLVTTTPDIRTATIDERILARIGPASAGDYLGVRTTAGDWLINGQDASAWQFDDEGRIVGRISFYDTNESRSKDGADTGNGGRPVWMPGRLEGDMQAAGADVTDKWFACPGGRAETNRRRPDWPDRIFLQNRVVGGWHELKSPQPFHAIYDVKIIGDAVYSIFVYNPDAAAGPRNRGDFLLQGDPLVGIMEYDIEKTEWRLLVSSRRMPAASPLDGKMQKPPERLLKVSDGNKGSILMVDGFPGHVYDARTRAWRASASEEIGQAKKLEEDARFWRLAGRQWFAWASEGRAGFLERGRGKTPVRLALEFDTSGENGLLARLPEDVRRQVSLAGLGGGWATRMSGGLLLWRGPVYYWIPKARLEEALMQ